MSTTLSAEVALRASKPKRRWFQSEELGGSFYIHSLSAAARFHVEMLFSAARQDGAGDVDPYSDTFAASVRDANGDLIFSPAQARKLSENSGHEVARVAEIALGLSGIPGFTESLAQYDRDNPAAKAAPDPEDTNRTPEGNLPANEPGTTS